MEPTNNVKVIPAVPRNFSELADEHSKHYALSILWDTVARLIELEESTAAAFIQHTIIPEVKESK